MSLPGVEPEDGGNIVRKALMPHIRDPSRLVRTEAIESWSLGSLLAHRQREESS